MALFQTYTDQQLAMQDLVALKDKGIDADLSQQHENGVLIFSLNVPDVELERAFKMLGGVAVAEVAPNNYLAELTDDELIEILVEEDKNTQLVVENAKQLLLERDPEFDFTTVHARQYLESISDEKGEKAHWGHLLIGYILALLGGLIGISIGWFIETGKKKSVDGNTYYTYDEPSRFHGRVIKWLGIACLIGWTVYWFVAY